MKSCRRWKWFEIFDVVCQEILSFLSFLQVSTPTARRINDMRFCLRRCLCGFALAVALQLHANSTRCPEFWLQEKRPASWVPDSLNQMCQMCQMLPRSIRGYLTIAWVQLLCHPLPTKDWTSDYSAPSLTMCSSNGLEQLRSICRLEADSSVEVDISVGLFQPCCSCQHGLISRRHRIEQHEIVCTCVT